MPLSEGSVRVLPVGSRFLISREQFKATARKVGQNYIVFSNFLKGFSEIRSIYFEGLFCKH